MYFVGFLFIVLGTLVYSIKRQKSEQTNQDGSKLDIITEGDSDIKENKSNTNSNRVNPKFSTKQADENELQF